MINRGRATPGPGMPTLTCMEGVAAAVERVAAAWRRWRGSPVRDALLALVVTVVLVFGSIGEGDPNNPSDRIQFRGHAAPHPTAALLLVGVACVALAWRRRWPVAVLAVSVGAVAA